MREMKDSGIEWIGNISSKCTLVPLKFFLEDKDSIKVGPFGSQLSGNDFADEETDYWVYNQRTVIDNEYKIGNAFIHKEKYDLMTSFQVHTDDILITTRGTIGKISKVPNLHKKGVLHPCIIRFRIDSNKYSYKLLEIIFNKSDFITRQILYKSNATTIEVIYSETLKNIIIPYFDINIQNTIADFLDSKCSEIDGLISDIQKQITTLEEYKRSVITESVTKGLNPDAEMKDSGVDYIEKMNSKWKLTKLRYICNKLNRYFDSNAEALICSNKGEVFPRGENSIGLVSDNDKMFQGVCKGDLLIHGMDTWHGAIAISDYNGKCTNVVHVCDSMQNKRFICYYLQMLAFKSVYKAISNGVRENTSDFRSWDKAGNIYITLPTIEEQNKIAEYIHNQVNQINSIISEKKQQIEAIDDYKKSLIFEYVTGKKEVYVNE